MKKMKMDFIMECLTREESATRDNLNAVTEALENPMKECKALLHDEWIMHNAQLSMIRHMKELIMWEYENQYPQEEKEVK